MLHETTCPRIKAIEYQADGVTVKRIEFHAPQPLHVGPPMQGYLSPQDPNFKWYGRVA